MIIVHENTEKKMAKVKEFADKVGLLEQLNGQLEYLGNYACNEENGMDFTKCTIYSDFAPMSFQFTMQMKNKKGEYEHFFNGGLIYQGPNIPANGNYPSFSVSMDNSKVGWFIHT